MCAKFKLRRKPSRWFTWTFVHSWKPNDIKQSNFETSWASIFLFSRIYQVVNIHHARLSSFNWWEGKIWQHGSTCKEPSCAANIFISFPGSTTISHMRHNAKDLFRQLLYSTEKCVRRGFGFKYNNSWIDRVGYPKWKTGMSLQTPSIVHISENATRMSTRYKSFQCLFTKAEQNWHTAGAKCDRLSGWTCLYVV